MRMTNDDSYTNCLVAFHAVFRASSRGLKMQKRAHCDQLQVTNLSIKIWVPYLVNGEIQALKSFFSTF